MNGRALKAALAQLMQQHRIAPLERPAMALLPATSCAQIVEGLAASPDIDAERMSFKAGSLSWSNDLPPLLLRHDGSKIAGRILDLRTDADGVLRIRARVDDLDAARMPAFSIAATVIESEVRNAANPSGFHFVITRATLDHVAITDHPANARAIVTCRRDVSAADSSSDAAQAAAVRAQKLIEELAKTWSAPPSPSRLELNHPAPAHIYGRLPAAMLLRKRTPFAQLVSRLPVGDDRHA